MVLDETLRLYPPAWIGPRRVARDFEFAGYRVPAGFYVNYCSWASHRLPEVFPEPEAFLPERFTRERKASLPPGAYVPFGGGALGSASASASARQRSSWSRRCCLARLRPELLPGRTMKIRQMPALSPKGGLQMRLLER